MKCETTNTVLTLALAVLVLADVWLALRTIILQRESRNLQSQVMARQGTMNRLNVVLTNPFNTGRHTRTSIMCCNRLSQSPPHPDYHERTANGLSRSR